MLELKANPSRSAAGVVIEAKLEKGRGPVATVLVQEGTLRDRRRHRHRHPLRPRPRHDERARRAGRRRSSPATRSEVLGLSGVPTAGDDFNVVEDEKAAKEIAEHRAAQGRARPSSGKTSRSRSEDAASPRPKAGEAKELQRRRSRPTSRARSRRSPRRSSKLSTPKVKVNIVHKGVGAMTESDVMHRRGRQGHGRRLQHQARVQAPRRRPRPAGRRASCTYSHHLRAARRRPQATMEACSSRSAPRRSSAGPRCATSSTCPKLGHHRRLGGASRA